MIALAFAAALAQSLVGAGLVGVDRPIVTGADYTAACHGQDPRQQAACMSYLTAVIATADAFHADSLRQRGEEGTASFICPTGGMEGLQAHALAAILTEPALAPQPAAVGILTGVLDAYPCKDLIGPEANTPNTGDDLLPLGGYSDEGLDDLGD